MDTGAHRLFGLSPMDLVVMVLRHHHVIVRLGEPDARLRAERAHQGGIEPRGVDHETCLNLFGAAFGEKAGSKDTSAAGQNPCGLVPVEEFDTAARGPLEQGAAEGIEKDGDCDTRGEGEGLGAIRPKNAYECRIVGDLLAAGASKADPGKDRVFHLHDNRLARVFPAAPRLEEPHTKALCGKLGCRSAPRRSCTYYNDVEVHRPLDLRCVHAPLEEHPIGVAACQLCLTPTCRFPYSEPGFFADCLGCHRLP